MRNLGRVKTLEKKLGATDRRKLSISIVDEVDPAEVMRLRAQGVQCIVVGEPDEDDVEQPSANRRRDITK